MSLVTKTVKVKWNGSNKLWYISKGYKYTKQYDEFEINIKDLSEGSSKKVQVQCDNKECKIIKTIRWSDYIKYIKQNKGKYYCPTCLNTKNKRILKRQSFYNWCYENLDKEKAEEILNRWDYELNKCSPKEVGYHANKKYYFKCNKHPEHESELHNISSFVTNYIKSKKSNMLICSKCNSFAQWGIDNIDKDFLEKYWSDKNTLNPWKITKASAKKVWLICQSETGNKDYEISCSHFRNGERCPYCTHRHGKVRKNESLGAILQSKNLLYIWSNKNKTSPFDYTYGSTDEMWWKCINKKHKDFKKQIYNMKRNNFHCPSCIQEREESFLQEKVRLYLESLNNKKYTILHEYECTIVPVNPKFKNLKGQMPFDNEIKELKLIVEVHGIQHYKITNFEKLHSKRFNTTPKYELHRIQLHDRYKKYIAYKKEYYYLALPYWTDDKDETWKDLINIEIEYLQECNKILKAIKEDRLEKMLLELNTQKEVI